MKRVAILSTAIAAALIAGTSAANAAVVFDGSLASPSTNPATPGWYDGSGNPNGGFTIDTENGIELGLRAKLRQSPNVIDSSSDLYTVPAGPQAGSPTHAAWNYEYSIDLQPNGVGTLTLADITASLTITDVTTGATTTVNPLNVPPVGYVSDDAGFGSGGKDVETSSDWGAQNSENPIFANFGIPFNENSLDLYQFTLTVDNAQTGAQLASDTIQVQVTPLPKAAYSGLAMISLLGAGMFFRKRRQMA